MTMWTTDNVVPIQPTEQQSPLEWIESFILTPEEEKMLTDAKWIYPNLIIQGHVMALVHY